MLHVTLPKSLVIEAKQMLNAIINDLQEIASLKIKVLCDSRIESMLFNNSPTVDHILISQLEQFEVVWQQTIRGVDAVLVIAPETNGILLKLCSDVERAGKLLLNSTSLAVSVASSKLKTSQLLSSVNIPVITTLKLDGLISPIFPFVIKPDDGVGCESIFIIKNQHCLDLWVKSSNLEGMVTQPWVRGQAASLSVIFSENEVQILTYNRQLIKIENDRVVLTGCLVGDYTEYWTVYQTLVREIADCLPGLRGYVGIDVVETEEGPVILEINPRLTTSYAGISQAIGVNPAVLILQSFNIYFNHLAINPNVSIKPVTIDLKSLQ